MAADDKGKGLKETIADEAKGLAVEVYKDAAKPAIGEVGSTLGAVAKLVLWPVKKIAEGATSALEKLSARVEKKLEDVPKDRLQPPPATIAAPAALQYALLGESEEVAELREMFENLLVASMDRGTAASAHPAFVSIIAQMTPDEAWILKSIDRDDYAVTYVFESTPGGRRSLGFRTALGLGAGIDESRLQQYISNLDRLGILRISNDIGSGQVDYTHLQRTVRAEFQGRSVHKTLGSVAVTPLGRQFLDTCVRARSQ